MDKQSSLFCRSVSGGRKKFYKNDTRVDTTKRTNKIFFENIFFSLQILSQSPVWEMSLQMWFTILILKQLLLDTV